MATNSNESMQNQWEVVDGLQRLLTLVHFAGEDRARLATGLGESVLKLRNLEKLDTFDGETFAGLPQDLQSAFEDRPMKVVVLNDKSDLQVRYDLFERLNTGGISLTAHEIRECVFRGDFINLLVALADTDEFKGVVVLPDGRWKDGTPQEYVLRFFAYLEGYERFEHSVIEFLNEFTRTAYEDPDVGARTEIFKRTFRFLDQTFPRGIRSRLNQTPANLFEAISVGAGLALREKPELQVPSDTSWITSDELRHLTTGATNSRPRVKGRIEYCRDRFLAADV